MTSFDAVSVAKRFPALHRTQQGRPVVFVDAPGGTQVPTPVIDAIAAYLSDSNANEGGAFGTSRETVATVDSARSAMADLLGCDSHDVVFGPNMTTLAFNLARSLARDLGPGDEVVVTRLDHDANVTPWVTAAEDAGATVRWVDITTPECAIDLADLESALSDSTRLVAFPLASNAVGTIPDAKEIVRLARQTYALVIADAVHYAPHHLIDVAELGVDFLFCSPYKFFGPHLGVMYGRKHLLDELRPYKVRPSSDASPERWETGTKDHEALAGLSACVDYLAGLADAHGGRRTRLQEAFAAIVAHERELSARFLSGVAELPGVELFGMADPSAMSRTPTFALRLSSMSPREVATQLGERGIFTWDGNYYALALMERLGLEESGGALRIGFCHYHSLEDVDRVLEALGELT